MLTSVSAAGRSSSLYSSSLTPSSTYDSSDKSTFSRQPGRSMAMIGHHHQHQQHNQLHHHHQQHPSSSPSSPSVSSSSASSSAMHDHHHHQDQKDCNLCWSSHTYAKTRTIRLRRKDQNTSLGFSIRGGYEHGIGFFVSEVQQHSLAAKKGLCAGDQILQINGFPLERVVHEEVVALIRLSSNDLHLRVRSTGLVPQKGGEGLTWKRLHSALAGSTGAGGSVNGACTATSGSSEVSSFVFTRPRSAASDSYTPPSSASSSSEENNLNHLACDHHHHHNHHHHHLSGSSEESEVMTACSNSPPPPPPPLPHSHPLLPLPLLPYSEKQLYIRCHQPGSSLGCSVVNGPASCPGIFVAAVKEGKLAAKCGLEVGDQIVKVNSVDVGAIGFEGAITLLKSLTNLSLLVRKGVARHIFECSRDTYDVFGASKECHFTTTQRHHAFSNGTPKPLVKSPSESSLYYPASSSTSSNQQSSPLYSYYHHHQQQNPHQNQQYHKSTLLHQKCSSYATVAISSSTSNEASNQIASSTCDKPRCCCKRQRTVTALAAAAAASAVSAVTGNSSAAAVATAQQQFEQLSLYEPCGHTSNTSCSSCTLMTLQQGNSNLQLHHQQASQNHHTHQDHYGHHYNHYNHHHLHSHHHQHQQMLSNRPLPPPPPDHQLAFRTTDPVHLDQVTSAMANSIRILREVREKEEKLVEASRKLSEEHQKLCREKEKLKLYELEKSSQSSDHRNPDTTSSTNKPSNIPTPPSFESFSINSQYSTLSTAPLGSSTLSSSVSGAVVKAASANRHNTVGPTFSFLEEIKALGEHGTKRHLRPVNSSDTFGGRGSLGAESTDTTNSDTKGKLLRRLVPFGVASGVGVNGVGGVGVAGGTNSKEAETKQRQHELLMEEFRIAHQRMFGGKENNGTLLGKIRQQRVSSANSTEPSTPNEVSSPNHDSTNSTDLGSSAKQKEAMTRLVQSNNKSTPKLPAVLPSARSSAPSKQPQSFHSNNNREAEQSLHSNSSSVNTPNHNRITIKVLSPKLGT